MEDILSDIHFCSGFLWFGKKSKLHEHIGIVIREHMQDIFHRW
jgi:hypothetical protein